MAHDIRYEQDVVIARQRARMIAAEIGFDLLEQTRVGTAVSEIVRNAFRYAGGGVVTFGITSRSPQELVVTVSDKGPGIGNLDVVTSGRYVSTTGMGMGIVGARRLMDDFDLVTGPTGTVVTMRKRIPAHLHAGGADVAKIATALQKLAAGTPLEELQSQNHELIRAIHEIQQRQAEIERLNDELNETNRGVLALNAELEDKADSLRNVSETKSRFLSHMSHEFRTPLNSIRSLAKILAARMDGPLTEEQERQVNFIRTAAETLVEMVNDLLDLAKIEAGKLEIQPAAFTVTELFGAMRGMFRPLLVNSSVALRFRAAPGIPPFYTDEAKLSQILRNFISNAAKFTQEGSIDVEARLTPQDCICISVTDTGIGIAAENLPRVFEEFVQISNPLQKTAKGTGLGLPLSQRLAQLLGGKVEVESTLGVGSTFSLTVPRVAPGVIAPPPPADVDPEDRSHGARILIADDGEADRYTLRALLPDGCEVVEAHNGAEAIEAVASYAPTIVFLDLGMPDIDGFNVLRRLNEEDRLRSTSVVIHSAQLLSSSDVSRLRDLGALGVLPKGYVDLERARMEIQRFIDAALATEARNDGRTEPR